MDAYIPSPTTETQAFWDGCAAGELRYQVCSYCSRVQLIPRGLCAACHRASLRWERSGGQGVILTYTLVHRAPTSALRPHVPYLIALVDMAEGFRLMVNLDDSAREHIAIGDRVRIGFRQVGALSLPHGEVLR